MSENLKSIDGRLNELWSNGEFNRAYEVIVQELVPALQDYLTSDGLVRHSGFDFLA